jgi:tripartite-type tricarboxylate transporter receptor subunit TctC
MNLPEVKAVLSKAGLDSASSSPTELRTIVGKDYQRWGEVIKRNGIVAE